ncbi:hypothetical protein PVAND_006999 [Polypedilum vanderplanki]|uniref:Uncharacterized protein n=1 Tax=Polypedilum vanderplanki TaxID=319348 RepID=A0A9J6C5G7_POLVA|nr:hypothetical protein PVAND_006999 [Polypedilum vanderplanki]
MHFKCHTNAISLRFSLLFLLMILSSIKLTLCDIQRIEVNLSDCRKLEIYYQCKVNNLNIMDNDRHSVDMKINIPNQQPNDIRIESSNMSFIPSVFFEKFIDLKEFVAINCSIKNIYYSTFTSAFKLHYLVLSYNNIEYIADNAFRNVSDLQSLKLDNNEIEMLATNVFRGLNMLRTLILSFNKIAYLPLFIFHDLENLETLELNNNLIRIISAGQFESNRLLQHIDLNNNRLMIIDNGTFNDLINIQQLKLENNVCVNARVESREKMALSKLLKCCMILEGDGISSSCSSSKHEISKNNDDNGSSMSIFWTLVFFVSIFGNMLLIAYLFNNRAWLNRLRNRSEIIELVNCEYDENTYQNL